MNFAHASFLASQTMALQAHGVSHFNFEASKQASRVLDAKLGQHLALLGDVALVKAGATGNPYRLLLNRLWKQASWTPDLNKFVEPVKTAAAQLSALEKSANGIGGLTSMLARAGSDAKDGSLGLLGALLLMSGTGGASLGALNWHMRRGAEESDEANESLRAGISQMQDERRNLQALNNGQLLA